MPVRSYRSYEELAKHEKEGEDYSIEIRVNQLSPILILAPHGGDIEPGTAEIATHIAGDNHSLYIFRGFDGIDPALAWRFHITSLRFDEPRCLNLITQPHMKTVITIHGSGSEDDVSYIGGLNNHLRNHIAAHLALEGFPVEFFHVRYLGQNPKNICNRAAFLSPNKEFGVQLELPITLRDELSASKQMLEKYCHGIRIGISSYLGWRRKVLLCDYNILI